VTAAHRWCTLYVDTPDPATVARVVSRILGPGDHLDVFRVPGFTVDVRRNPDRTGGPHHLDWPSTVDIDAAADVPDEAVVSFATALLEYLSTAGLHVAADSNLPTPIPPVRPDDSAS
jgi:hypothetical protein